MKKEDKKMQKTSIKSPFSEKEIRDICKDKIPVKVKNGIAYINKDHPEYEYWMDD